MILKKNKLHNRFVKFFTKIFFVFVLTVNYASASESSGTITSTTYATALVCQDATCDASLGHRINFKPTGAGSNGVTAITIDDTNGVDGNAWGETIGWINFSAGNSATTTPGVRINPATGKLYGYAWAQNSGWINFAPTNYGVTINASGEFSGYAWAAGRYGGWINFDCSGGATTTCVKTDWRPTAVRTVIIPTPGGGGGGGGGSVVIPVATPTPITDNKYLLQKGVQNQPKDFSNDFRADINDSGLVDILDFNLLVVNWAKTKKVDKTLSKQERCLQSDLSDINCDGAVNILDFNLLLVYWNTYVGEQGEKLKNKILK